MHALKLCCSLGVMMLAGCARPTFTSNYPIAADDAVEAKLAAPVDVDYNATPLDDVLTDLLGRRDVNVYIKWPILRRASVDPETPITLQLKRVPAAIVLRLVMEQAGAHNSLEPVMATIRDGMVVVSTERDLQNFTITVFYDIEDLVTAVIAEGDWPVFELNDAMS